MKINLMKISGEILLGAILIVGCIKNDTPQPTTASQNSTNTDNYSSMANFFAQNGVTAQTYTVNATSGGSFTTLQGTVVTIPANSFYNQQWQNVSGTVAITFKDIYKKSDMLLSNMPTNMYIGAPLKSGGEFYIKATLAGNTLNLGGHINVSQPLGSFALDSNMRSFIKPGNDTTGWLPNDSAGYCEPVLAGYVFSLYQFNSPVDSGSWCNSDNPIYFSAYPQTTLTLQESDDPKTYGTYVFLVFKNINAMVHVYNNNGSFPYNYAPVGLQCTMVAIGIKGGKAYSSFTPITINTNQTVTFSMTETTTADFKSQLSALN